MQKNERQLGSTTAIEEMGFFAFLADNFDIDHRKIHKQYQLIQKLAWEQVLLLAIYSRQYCYVPEVNPYHTGALARMSLLAHATELSRQRSQDPEDKSPWQLTELVTTLLNQGEGSVAIVKQLLEQAEQEERNALSDGCSNLLSRMEREGISFAGGHSPHYNWYTLYVALTDPVGLFQQLLTIRPLDDEFYGRCAINALKTLLNKNYQPYFVSPFDNSEAAAITRAGLSVNTGEEFRQFIENYSDAINKLEYQQNLKAELMRILTQGVRAAFVMTDIPQLQKPLIIDTPSVMQKVCRPERKDNNVCLNIDTVLLRKLLELGQIDRVMEGIKHKLEDIAVGTWRDVWSMTTSPEDYAQAFDRLASWFMQCKTPLITAFDQIPRYVGAIIALDAKNRQGMFSDRLRGRAFEGLAEKLSAREVASITTHLFYYSLNRNVTPKVFIDCAFLHKSENSQGVEERLLEVSNRIDIQQDLHPLASTMMVNWQDCDQLEQAMERIKKIPNYLKFGAKRGDLTLSRWINTQRSVGISGKIPWPIDTPFPLPLWSGLSFTSDSDGNA